MEMEVCVSEPSSSSPETILPVPTVAASAQIPHYAGSNPSEARHVGSLFGMRAVKRAEGLAHSSFLGEFQLRLLITFSHDTVIADACPPYS